MPTGFDEAFRRVRELVANFRANEKFYLSQAYQESEARRDFIDKFWMALGWDVNHEKQKNPYEQEVKVERRDHSTSQRRADYAFYLAPDFERVKFYVEAKKPHGDIATADNYFQTIRYGWSSSTPIAVLHDFEQFEILDCRYRPHIDTALAQNLRKYHFSQYEDSEKFAEIYWLFSREAVANGSIEKFAATLPKKRKGARQRGLIGKGADNLFFFGGQHLRAEPRNGQITNNCLAGTQWHRETFQCRGCTCFAIFRVRIGNHQQVVNCPREVLVGGELLSQ